MFRSLFPESRDFQPLTWWGKKPVYLSAILAITGVLSMLVFAVIGYEGMENFIFTVKSAFKEWKLWTPLTYVLVNPPGLWTIFGCYLLWRFGESIERHFGRYVFVKLLVLLMFVSPLTITLLHLFGYREIPAIGMMDLEFGVFVAFATLYPRAKINLIILSIDAYIIALVLVGVDVLSSVAGRDWASLILILANVGSAYLFVRVEKGEITMPVRVLADDETPKPVRRKPKKSKAGKNEGGDPSVDDILDKISRNGMQSLTDRERQILNDASDKN